MGELTIWKVVGDKSICALLKNCLSGGVVNLVTSPGPPVPVAALTDSVEAAMRLKEEHPRLPVVFIRERASEQLAIEAWNAGCRGYVRCEHLYSDLLEALSRCLSPETVPTSMNARIRRQAEDSILAGSSAAMQAVRNFARRVAASPSNVLITGETGTGKELVARLIHECSSRRDKPMVCINCAALPDTLIESELFGYERGAFTGATVARDGALQNAAGGTIFLDEIGDMSPYAQAKVLRCIETRRVQRLGGRQETPVDIRVIAATNRSRDALASGDGFRTDLFYRLSVAHITLPPLRDRREDLPELAQRFIREMNVTFRRNVRSLSPRSLRWLASYDWPGNVRELRNVIESAFIHLVDDAPQLHLPQALEQRLAGTGDAESEAESGVLLRALLATNWNKSEAARALNWSRMTLYRKMTKYQLSHQSAVAGES